MKRALPFLFEIRRAESTPPTSELLSRVLRLTAAPANAHKSRSTGTEWVLPVAAFTLRPAGIEAVRLGKVGRGDAREHARCAAHESSARRSPRPRGAPRDSLPQYSRPSRPPPPRGHAEAPVFGPLGAPAGTKRRRAAPTPRHRASPKVVPSVPPTPHRPEVVPAAKQAHGPYICTARTATSPSRPGATAQGMARPRRGAQVLVRLGLRLSVAAHRTTTFRSGQTSSHAPRRGRSKP